MSATDRPGRRDGAAGRAGPRRRDAARSGEAPRSGAVRSRTATRRRDAARSRAAILDAAQRLFAARGYEATSMAAIGAAAGLSRGSPGYLFGSKRALYDAVLERVFAAREAALRPAVEPLLAWARTPGDARSLERALGVAVDGYLAFLAAHPHFVSLLEREALAGRGRLAGAPHESRALEDALRALRRAGPRQGIRRFDVEQVLLAWVALSFFPFAHRHTFLAAHGLDPEDRSFVAARRRQIVVVLLHLVRTPGR